MKYKLLTYNLLVQRKKIAGSHVYQQMLMLFRLSQSDRVDSYMHLRSSND